MFERAMHFLLRWEGGESNDPNDPGGHTKYGISKRQYPDEVIETLTVARATDIYRRDYWQPLRCAEMPYPVALVVFDMGVNAGPTAAVKCLQRALGVRDDGVLGPRTMAELAKADAVELARNIVAERLRFYASLNGWILYGRGWARRAVAAAIEGALWRQ